ncbi:MAG: chemotaxis protein CheZ [Bacteroidetes bacterium]|jgi:chemotaxis regulatin CheY-phosphate phosphatase CheZ|nr:chemotaxis protein CheZ [Bacteroidota bacterium]
MTSPRSLHDILGKLNELRAVFTLGQRAVPFIEEVLDFLREIAPLIEEIDASMRESTGKMPGATSQLENVTHQTELATNEILDLIDAVTAKLNTLSKTNETTAATVADIRQVDAHIVRVLRRALADQPDVLDKLNTLHERKKEMRRSLEAHTATHQATLQEIRGHMNRIMVSLQVQDITAQQIASVNHLIESIRNRMAILIKRLDSTPVETTPAEASKEQTLANGPTFDANARYTSNRTHQDAADAVFTGGTSPPPAPSSQDAIDALFDSGTTADAPDASAPPSDTTESPAAPDTPVSQDDIDSLFGGSSDGDAGSPASQDEIDELFSA